MRVETGAVTRAPAVMLYTGRPINHMFSFTSSIILCLPVRVVVDMFIIIIFVIKKLG